MYQLLFRYMPFIWLLYFSCCQCLTRVIAGYACLNNPCLHGVCMDRLNSSYSCYCEDGYTGVQCQTDWDECWSSPCLNGASCIDGVADFQCSCPSGFEGPRCEADVNECLSSPCLNGGTCRDGLDGYICLCGPGWDGIHCEVDLPVCNTSSVQLCRHEGQCIDGPGLEFYCLCQPGWSGQTCQDPVDECASNPCLNGAVCVDLEAAWACACPDGFTGKRCETALVQCESSPCLHNALCLEEEYGPRCYCVPDFHGTYCEYQYDECLLGNSCLFGGTCVDGVDSYSCLCPSDRVGIQCQEEAPETTTSEYISTTITSTDTSETLTTEYVDSRTSSTIITSTEFTSTEELSTYSSEEVNETLISTTESQTLSSTKTTEEMIPTIITTDASTTSYSTSEPISTKTTESVFSTTITDEKESRFLTDSTLETTSESTITTFSFIDISTENATKEIFPHENVTELITESYSSSESSYTFKTTTEKLETPELETTSTIDVTESTTITEITSISSREETTTEETFDYSQWSVSMNGNSFVAHRLKSSDSWRAAVILRTLHSSGLVLGMIRSDGPPTSRFLIVSLSDGRLAVRWSCGIQSMAFTEVRTRIDTGDEVNLEAALWTDPISGRCRASLAVNGTHAMSGQQQQPILAPLSSGWLYLGGLSNAMSAIPGFEIGEDKFIGCLSALRIDGKMVHIIEEAAASTGTLVQCGPPACLQRPCAYGGTCMADNTEQGWRCACPPGRQGPRCRGHVCSDNPCLYGGTCTPAAGVAFVCVCPLGRHGLLCEHELQVTEPQFGPSIGGLSAFAAYPLPWAEESTPQGLEITLILVPANDEQIGLVLFTGGLNGDHLALSFIQGIFAMTWDLGTGPRRIFTNDPLPVRPYGTKIQVKLGLYGRRGWLQVQGSGNVTGRSPGNASALDASPLLYLGGHEAPAFASLPHDIPLHRGFQGCIVSAEVRVGWSAKPWSVLGRTAAARGRGVGQCGTAPCPAKACSHGGACLPVGASYACLCPFGWYGPVCGQDYDPCEPSPCLEGGTCISLPDGPQCDCPPGRIGDVCEQEDIPKNESIGFRGQRSFLAISLMDNFQDEELWLTIEIRSVSLSGLILFWQSWGLLAHHGGVLELRLAEGVLGKPLIVRGARVLAANEWHHIEIRLYGRQVTLSIDGARSWGVMSPQSRAPIPKGYLFLGGIPDFSRIPPDSPAGSSQPFNGCMRALMMGGREIVFWQGNMTNARNIHSCDAEWGRKGCPSEPCTNGGKCVAHTCRCTRGFVGQRCSERTNAARVKKDGYLEIRPPSDLASLVEPSAKMRASHLQLNFSTADASAGSAMLLWAEQSNWTLGLGISEGRIKLVIRNDAELIPVGKHDGDPADGAWHELTLTLGPKVQLTLDRHVLLEKPLEVNNEWRLSGALFGGVPGGRTIREITQGHFDRGFRGCIQTITWGTWSPQPAFLPGLNIDSCPFS